MVATFYPQWPGDPARYPGWALEQHSAHCLALRLPDTTHPLIVKPLLTKEAIDAGIRAKAMLLEMEAWVPKGYIRDNRVTVKEDAMRRDYRIAGFWGGRGGSKSHAVCEAIVELASIGYERVVCGREFMASIRDSSRSLLASKIRKSRYTKDWIITDRELKNSRTGSLITFLGVNRNTDNLRSLEGCTLFFGEEAESFAQESLDILIPTVRAPGSRFIFCWNPTFGGPVDEMLRMGIPPERSLVRGVLTEDNVWFYKTELPSERRSSFRKHSRLKFRHIWRGDLDTNPDVLVYNNWSVGRIEIPSHVSPIYGLDWGWTDPLAMTETWIVEPDDPDDETTKAKMYISRQIYGTKIPISHLPRMIREEMPLANQFTIVADSAEPKSIDYMNTQGFHVIPAAKGPGSVRAGISDIQGYDVFISPDCQDVINEFGSYKWKKTKSGVIVRDPVDADNHTLDSIRYAKESYVPSVSGSDVVYI